MKIIAATIVAFMLGGYQIADSSYYVAPMQEIIQDPVVIKQVCIVTAYTAAADECGGKSDGITASGTKVTENRTVAADHLPFGTRIRINGQEYIVEDRFGGGYHNKIDIYMPTKAECFEFGQREIEVEIIENQR